MCVLTCRSPDVVREANSVRSTCRSRNFLQQAVACGDVLCKSSSKDCKEISIHARGTPQRAGDAARSRLVSYRRDLAPIGISRCNRASTSPQPPDAVPRRHQCNFSARPPSFASKSAAIRNVETLARNNGLRGLSASGALSHDTRIRGTASRIEASVWRSVFECVGVNCIM
jgi:hypothetical protein